MKKSTLSCVLAAVVAVAAAWFAGVHFSQRSYAVDRAEVDNLLARYMFALDWQDPQLYASLFTADGVLIWAGGTVNGRQAIVAEIGKARAADQRAAAAAAPLRPARRRHFATSTVLRIDGNTATARTYWFEFNNDNADRHPYLGAYGHLEDELRRVDGQWLIARHRIFNEQRPAMVAPDKNPAW